MYILKCQIQNKIKFPKKLRFLKKINDIIVVKTHLVTNVLRKNIMKKDKTSHQHVRKKHLELR